jgi:hypothetical protein
MIQSRHCIDIRVFLVFALVSLAGWGCIADNRVELRSMASASADVVSLPFAAFINEGSGGASIYMTNLAPEALDAGADLSRVSGRITQIRMFLTPSAGNTPIGRSACTATLRHIILANGTIGVYSGGGFLWPSGSIDSPRFGGRIEDATMRLTGSIGAFSDRLGASTLNATVSAKRDAALAQRISARIDDVLRLTGDRLP